MSRNKNDNPGCLSLFFPKSADKKEVSFPYRLKEPFLSPSEHSFYLVAQMVLGDKFTICPQVSMAEIFSITGHENYYVALNRIIQRRIDFLVCDAVTMKPRFAIELDDSSHSRPNRVERDEFVDSVFQAAGFPLVHVKAKNGYVPNELEILFEDALGNNAKKEPAQPAMRTIPINAYGAAPDCPKCGAKMNVQISKAGTNVGEKFYVCTKYPNCRTFVRIEEA